jgi:hypothetical protein
MVLKQLVVFADSDVSLRLETVADQTAISSNTVSPAPLRIRRSTPWADTKLHEKSSDGNTSITAF